MKQTKWQEKITKNKEGRTILWQKPNLPIIVWAVATVVSKIFSQGDLHVVLVLIAFGSIFTWSWLEIFDGANYLRRSFGILVLFVSIYNRVF